MKAPRQPVDRSAWWGTRAPAKNHMSEFGKWFSSLMMTAGFWDTLSQDHPAHQLPDSWPTELWMGQCPVKKRGGQEWEAAKYSTRWAPILSLTLTNQVKAQSYSLQMITNLSSICNKSHENIYTFFYSKTWFWNSKVRKWTKMCENHYAQRCSSHHCLVF